MPKAGEISYLAKLGPEGQRHALNKPFSDKDCGRYLMDLGAMMSLLPPPPARLLDLGVGSGWTSVFFAKRGYEVVGQDIAEDMIALAEQNREAYGVENLRFVVGDYEELAFSSEFDCATFFSALHHSEDEWGAMASVYRALKDGGVCVTLEPGEGHAQQQVSREVVEKYGVTERDMPPHQIIAAGRAAGFREFEVFPCPLDLQPVAPTSRLRFGLRQGMGALRALLRFGPGPGIDYYRITALVRMQK